MDVASPVRLRFIRLPMILSPRHSQLARAAFVFFLAGVIAAALVVTVAWARTRLSGRSPLSAVSRVADPIPLTDFGLRLNDRLLTGQECATAARAMRKDDLRALLRTRDAAFWRTNPNACVFLRQAASLLARQTSPPVLIEEIAELLSSQSLDEGMRCRLLVAAMAGLLETRNMTREEVVAGLRKLSGDDAFALLEVWLDFQRPTSPQNDLAIVRDLATQIFPKLENKRIDDLAVLVVRVWAHRAPPVGQALLFADKIEGQELQRRLLMEGARVLAVANPGELQRRVVEFAPQWTRDVVWVAFSAGLSLEEAQAAAASMPKKAGDEFLGGFINRLYDVDPREMSKIAAAYGPKELPQSATAVVTRGFMATGNSGGLEKWMEGLAATDRAKLWDQAIGAGPGQGPRLSAADARLYLDKRPHDVPANIWALRSAAWGLPDQEADAVLQLVDSANGPAYIKEQARTVIASRRLSALITDASEKVSEFLGTVRDEDRERVIEEVLDKGAEREATAVRQWADECQDIALRARIENKIAENEIRFGNIARVEKRAFGLLQVGASPQACAPIFNQLVTAYASDSAKATALIQRLPAGELRDQMSVSFVQKWAEFDPASASEWIAQLPPGRGRDLAVRELVISSRDDPAGALANAAGIEDAKTRLDAARLVLRVWRDVDPAQAAALLPTTGFPATELPALRAALGVEPSSSAQP